MTNHKCRYEEHIRSMDKKIDNIAVDVRSLLKFKWQIMGGTAVITFLVMSVAAFLK